MGSGPSATAGRMSKRARGGGRPGSDHSAAAGEAEPVERPTCGVCSIISRMAGIQPPQQLPARQARTTRAMVVAPDWAAARISRSETAWQWQMRMATGAEQSSNLKTTFNIECNKASERLDLAGSGETPVRRGPAHPGRRGWRHPPSLHVAPLRAGSVSTRNGQSFSIAIAASTLTRIEQLRASCESRVP